jgi:hypothetical protein
MELLLVAAGASVSAVRSDALPTTTGPRARPSAAARSGCWRSLSVNDCAHTHPHPHHGQYHWKPAEAKD